MTKTKTRPIGRKVGPVGLNAILDYLEAKNRRIECARALERRFGGSSGLWLNYGTLDGNRTAVQQVAATKRGRAIIKALKKLGFGGISE